MQSQYQQALAAIPSIERQIAEQENLISVLLGRNPGPIPRGKTLEQLELPPSPRICPRRCWSAVPTFSRPSNLVAANA